MTAIEFCYWLQGFFELANPQELTAVQVELIRRHLQLVFHHVLDANEPANQAESLAENNFCYWLQGMFELGNPQQLEDTRTQLIKRHLDMVFHHVIDLTYPVDQQAALAAIHNEPSTLQVEETGGWGSAVGHHGTTNNWTQRQAPGQKC